MEEVNYQFPDKEFNLSNYKKVILLFLLIIVIVPFYESKRVIRWGIQEEVKGSNIFQSSILLYAYESEKLKEIFDLNKFFKKEHAFWAKIKESPLVFHIEYPEEILKREITGLIEQKVEKLKEAEKTKVVEKPQTIKDSEAEKKLKKKQ